MSGRPPCGHVRAHFIAHPFKFHLPRRDSATHHSRKTHLCRSCKEKIHHHGSRFLSFLDRIEGCPRPGTRVEGLKKESSQRWSPLYQRYQECDRNEGNETTILRKLATNSIAYGCDRFRPCRCLRIRWICFRKHFLSQEKHWILPCGNTSRWTDCWLSCWP